MTRAGWVAALVGALAIVMATLAGDRLRERGMEARRAEVAEAADAVGYFGEELEEEEEVAEPDPAAVAEAAGEVRAARERLSEAEDRLERFESAGDFRFLTIAYWAVAVILAAYAMSLMSRLRRARESRAARM